MSTKEKSRTQEIATKLQQKTSKVPMKHPLHKWVKEYVTVEEKGPLFKQMSTQEQTKEGVVHQQAAQQLPDKHRI